MQPSSLSHSIPTRKPPNYKWQVQVLGTVVFGFFMILLDVTVINVAFQTLRLEFGGGITESQWIISIYVMSMGIVMPLAGFMAERFGSKKTYLFALALFAIGSLLCGISNSLLMLIVSRMIQGIGGGLAIVNARMKARAMGGEGADDETGYGIWLDAGLYTTLRKNLNIGIDGRWSKADLELFDRDAQAGGWHIGVMAGFHW